MVLLYHTYSYMSIGKFRRVTSNYIGRLCLPLLHTLHKIRTRNNHEGAHEQLSDINVFVIYFCNEVNNKNKDKQDCYYCFNHYDYPLSFSIYIILYNTSFVNI